MTESPSGPPDWPHLSAHRQRHARAGDPLASAVIVPTVLLGGAPMNVEYAGRVPGSIGLYQINAVVPPSVPFGLEIPLVVNQGGSSTQLSVRVVKK